MKNYKIQSGVTKTLLVLGLSVASSFALAQGRPLQPDLNQFGNTQGEWTARWWQWALSIPNSTNPIQDTTGTNCTLGQSGAVWFLAGTTGNAAVTRTCTVPSGKSLFFPLVNSVWGEGVGDCMGASDCDPTALRKSAFDYTNKTKSLEVTVDNAKLKNLYQYRVTSPVFNVFAPSNAVFGITAGTHSPLVSDGYWLFLKPLSRGAHTIHFKAVLDKAPDPDFVVDVTYNLTVTP